MLSNSRSLLQIECYEVLRSRLIHVQTRDFDQLLARLLSSDQGQPETRHWNLNRYVKNDPINAVDPSGLESFPEHDGFWTDPNGKIISRDEVLKTGNGWWNSTKNPELLPVEFKNGRPDYTFTKALGGPKFVEIEFEYTGVSRQSDMTRMNAAMRRIDPGWEQPKGYTWHHASYYTKDGKHMGIAQLVPSNYNQIPHTGGRSDFENKVPTPKNKIHTTATDGTTSALKNNKLKKAAQKLLESGEANKFIKVSRRSIMLLLAAYVLARAITEAQDKCGPALRLGDDDVQQLFKDFYAAAEAEDFQRMEQILFGNDIDNPDATRDNPSGLILKILQAYVNAGLPQTQVRPMFTA